MIRPENNHKKDNSLGLHGKSKGKPKSGRGLYLERGGARTSALQRVTCPMQMSQLSGRKDLLSSAALRAEDGG